MIKNLQIIWAVHIEYRLGTRNGLEPSGWVEGSRADVGTICVNDMLTKKY